MRATFGLSTALVTPFRQDGGVDVDKLGTHARWCLANGCRSVTVFGTTGEGASVAHPEQDAVLGHLRAAGLDLRGNVIACVAEDSAETAATRIRAFHEADCRAILLCPPHYYKNVSDAGLLEWFRTVFRQLGGHARNVILYHIPGVTGVGLSASMVAALRDGWPDAVIGIKDSSGDPEQARVFLDRHGDLEILVGDERLLAGAVRNGASGSISGLANVVPRELAAMIRSGEENQGLSALTDAVVAREVSPAVKALVARRTGDESWLRVRPPLVALRPDDCAALAEALEQSGFG